MRPRAACWRCPKGPRRCWWTTTSAAGGRCARSGWQPGRGGPSLIVYDGVPADLPLPYRVTSVEQPTGVESGRAIAQLVLNLLAGEPVDKLHQLAQPVIAPGDTDGPVARRG